MNTDLLQSGLPPANDRMLTTCFLAAVFHGIIILGVTFSASKSDAGGPEAPTMEVVLVDGRAPPAAKNAKARYIAQRTQLGSANTTDNGRTSIPRSSPAPLDRAGRIDGEGSAAPLSGGDPGDDDLVATHAPSVKILYFAASMTAPAPTRSPQLLENRPDLGLTPNDEGVELHMRGERATENWIAADTRESDVAVYLDGWRHKIEQVGTMNFPDVARRRKLSGTPVIEVTIGADGKLLHTIVRRSSGHAEIDEAAMRILKLAAPYDPFPGALTAKHDQIRIAYEWQFLGGENHGGVFHAEPGAAQ